MAARHPSTYQKVLLEELFAIRQEMRTMISHITHSAWDAHQLRSGTFHAHYPAGHIVYDTCSLLRTLLRSGIKTQMYIKKIYMHRSGGRNLLAMSLAQPMREEAFSC